MNPYRNPYLCRRCEFLDGDICKKYKKELIRVPEYNNLGKLRMKQTKLSECLNDEIREKV